MAKRFYKKVEASLTEGGFHVKLDGRVLKTPGKKPLSCPTKNQATCVADEWEAQKDEIKPETMPCTRLMNVACELTPSRRPELIKEFRQYCETDLLCYRADQPQDLVKRQAEFWQPILDWSAKKYGIELATTSGIAAIVQSTKSLNEAANFAENLDDVRVTVLLHFTASLGSAILALAVIEKKINAKEAFEISRLDEIFQNERWGEDDEALARNKSLREELADIEKLI